LSERGDAGGWAGFRQQNQDLLEPDRLLRHYRPSELDSELARRTFVLPRPYGSAEKSSTGGT